ncbi:MAG TPA: hypothetical protein VE978_08955 [Chitinophagales bacterium]|nr:hypothetical protein [Chitinophagales bacterium]
MKSLKVAFLFLVIIFAIASVSHAQDTHRKTDSTATQATPQTKEEANKDFDTRVAKLQQALTKMQAKDAKVKDPQMKADLEAMMVKMKQIIDEYNAMKNTAGMSEQQQEQSKKKIKVEMDEARKMHEDMKAKYGDQMGGKAKKGTPPPPPPPQEEPAPK